MKKILAIDDQKDNLTIYEAVIDSRLGDHKVLMALSGKEGVIIAREQQPDAILLDILMPDMDGYETCRILKEDELTKHIPIIMITALETDTASRAKGLNMGADTFLSKPIDAVEFTAQLNVVLRIKEAEDKLRDENYYLKTLSEEQIKKIVKSEDNYRTIFEDAYDGIIHIDKNLTVLNVNQAFTDITGISKENMIGKSGFSLAKKFVNIKQLPKILGILKNMFVNKEVLPYELNYKNKILEILPKKQKSGYQTAVIRDITERKKSEESLLKLSTVVDQSPSIILITGIDGKIEYVNPKFTEITGYSLDESSEQLPKILMSGNHSDEVYQELWQTISSGKVWHGEFYSQKKNGKFYWEAASISPLFDKHGKIINYIKVAEDISERKLAEDNLIDALEKAEESDRLKSAFLANMSHEIRTPMNGILGFASLLKVPNLSGDQLKKYVGIIDKSGKRMLNIINNLIDISKIEAGQMEINISDCNINEQVEYLFTFFKPDAVKVNLDLSYNNPLPTKDALVKTDREKLYAILTNLLKNALKYTHEGSIKLGYERRGEMLEFYVKDTGIGIPTDRLDAIFERFIQADIEDRRAYEGAGLGLSITKAYVKMLGGKIWVDSVEGQGSQFYFTIPFKMDKSLKINTEVEKEQKLTATSKRLKILIAEDEDVAAQYLSIIIRELSKEKILHAKSGEEVINLCRSNPDLDLVLMDIKMPGMDGYDATREIRKFNKEVVIIAQTAYALAGDREKSIDAGCDDYISKPINQTELLEIIGKHLKR